MRVLVTGNSKYWKVGASIVRALRRAGHETLMLDDRKVNRMVGWTLTQKWAVRQARAFKPDFVILDKCTALDHETVYAIIKGRPNAMWYHDPPWVDSTHLPDIARVVSIMHMAQDVYVTGYTEGWSRHRAGVRFLPAAGEMELVPVAPDPRFAADLAFIGTGYAADRAEFLAAVARGSGARLRTWGQGWDQWKDEVGATGVRVEREEFAKVCSSSAICLGVNPAHATQVTDWVSNRLWLTILGGGFYLGGWGAGLATMLHDGEHCAFYRDRDGCVRLVREYLGDPERRDRIRRQGEAFVRRHHTFDERIKNLLGGYAFRNPLA